MKKRKPAKRIRQGDLLCMINSINTCTPARYLGLSWSYRDRMKVNDISARAGCTMNNPQVAAITQPSDIPSVPVLCGLILEDRTDTWTGSSASRLKLVG